MRATLLVVTFLTALSGPLSAQAGANDTLAPRMRQRIEARFREVAREELGLTNEQSDRVWATQMKYADRRRALGLATKDVNQVIATQLRPGVAADPAVLSRAIDSLGALHVTEGRLFNDEQRDLAGFLTPLQRAQLYRLRARINARVGEVILDRERAVQRRPGGVRRP